MPSRGSCLLRIPDQQRLVRAVPRPPHARRRSRRAHVGTLRNRSSVVCTRILSRFISGASGATTCSARIVASAGRAARATHRRDEGRLLVAVQRDRHIEVLVGLRRPHQVVAVHIVERRRAKSLVHHHRSVSRRRQQIGVAVTGGVLHLGHHTAQHAPRVVAPVQGQRIEHMTEHPGLRQRGDRAAVELRFPGRRGRRRPGRAACPRAPPTDGRAPRNGRTAAATTAAGATRRDRRTSCSCGARSSGGRARGAGG